MLPTSPTLHFWAIKSHKIEEKRVGLFGHFEKEEREKKTDISRGVLCRERKKRKEKKRKEKERKEKEERKQRSLYFSFLILVFF